MGILICGLNGSGKSTLGKQLADRLGYEFIDNEDLYFPKTDENYAFSAPRSTEEAIRILETRIDGNSRFVFAAVKGDYGDRLIASLDRIVLVEVPKEIRSRRVRERSFRKFGERILPGGDLHDREEAWFALTDGRPEDYKALTPADVAYYDGCIYVDLSAVECTIAMPMHPSHTFTIHELLENAADILHEVEDAANRQIKGARMDIASKYHDGGI